MSDDRLIAVFGYSRANEDGLHEICATRLRRAEREARPEDVVLLSGWGRGRRARSEAELMAGAWSGRCRRVFVDRRPRSTLGNVVGAAALARALQASEVLVVTSGWHGRRAATLLRSALRGSGPTVRLATTAEPGSFGTHLRELACWTFVPLTRLSVRGWWRLRAPVLPEVVPAERTATSSGK